METIGELGAAWQWQWQLQVVGLFTYLFTHLLYTFIDLSTIFHTYKPLGDPRKNILELLISKGCLMGLTVEPLGTGQVIILKLFVWCRAPWLFKVLISTFIASTHIVFYLLSCCILTIAFPCRLDISSNGLAGTAPRLVPSGQEWRDCSASMDFHRVVFHVTGKWDDGGAAGSTPGSRSEEGASTKGASTKGASNVTVNWPHLTSSANAWTSAMQWQWLEQLVGILEPFIYLFMCWFIHLISYLKIAYVYN